jgi:hypothetical protein
MTSVSANPMFPVYAPSHPSEIPVRRFGILPEYPRSPEGCLASQGLDFELLEEYALEGEMGLDLFDEDGFDGEGKGACASDADSMTLEVSRSRKWHRALGPS